MGIAKLAEQHALGLDVFENPSLDGFVFGGGHAITREI